MNRVALLGLAALLLAAGLLLVLDRPGRPARPTSSDVSARRPTLSGAPGPSAAPLEGSRTPSGLTAPAGAPGPAPEPADQGSGETGARPDLSLTPAELERLVVQVGERGAQALVEDPFASETCQRLEAAGAWTFERLPGLLGAARREVRIGAAALLGLHGRADATQALANQLDRETDPTARRVQLEALVALESPDSADALLRVWDDLRTEAAMHRIALQGLASLGHVAARAFVLDPRADPIERRVAEIGLLRAYRVRGADDPSLLQVVQSIAATSPHESSRREAAEALAGQAR